MARKPRLDIPGGLYHVILRGNAQQDIFFDDHDRQVFYDLLGEGSRRFGYRVHAFCLMSNHIHLAIQTSAKPLSQGLHNLSFRYTRHVNKTQGRAGHLFQGRYKALLVDADRYLLELVRYIHLNPVRARLVRDPVHYPHSGHTGYLGKRSFEFLTIDWVLAQFSDRADVARKRYARFVAEGSGEGHRDEFHQGLSEARVIGADAFTEQALRSAGESSHRAPTLDQLVEWVCESAGIDVADLATPSRNRALSRTRALIGWLAKQSGAGSLSALARRFRRDVSSLSRGVERIEKAAQGPSAQARRLQKYRDVLMQ
jgi:REP element-mobilizing transposase RayT